MKKLLYLVHRLPYPPNKGDKISSCNMLKHFAKSWRVHLGTFIDDPDDKQYVETVKDFCEDTHIADLNGSDKIIGSVRGLLTGQALSLAYYQNKGLADWVKRSIEQEMPDAVFVFSGTMAQYVAGLVPDDVPVIFDAEDVDSEKWGSYATTKPWPLSWLYQREAQKLLAYEREMAAATNISLFVSKEEADLFKTLAPESAEKIKFRTQGVDSVFFDNDVELENPYAQDAQVLVFTGAMDYWPNVEAVQWFCEHALAKLRQRVPDVQFYIVGMKPTADVIALGKLDGVTVTGGVPDVRPYLKYAHAACLPLQLARGIQNKVLEAMSMRLPVVATTDAMVGIIDYQDTLAYIADDVDGLIKKMVELLALPRQMNQAGRQCVLDHYNWDANLRKMELFMVKDGETSWSN